MPPPNPNNETRQTPLIAKTKKEDNNNHSPTTSLLDSLLFRHVRSTNLTNPIGYYRYVVATKIHFQNSSNGQHRWGFAW